MKITGYKNDENRESAIDYNLENTKIEYEKKVELTANQYTLYCMEITLVIVGIVWLLDMLNIFTIDQSVTTKAFVLFLIVYAIGRVGFYFSDLSSPMMKYYVILWAVILITILTTAFTYHAITALVIPIMYTSMYSSKKMVGYTYGLMVISTIITVFAGYYIGICDANMVLLTGKTLNDYILADNTFALNEINNHVVYTLTLFFVIPRCMICFVILCICRSISKIISDNVTYAQKMEHLAEVDQMTGVYNKSKYISMVEGGYRKEKKIAVIFWDINYLKKVNDSYGHEMGDHLILIFAKSIQELTNDSDKAYRIGGDEFVLIMPGAEEEAVKEKVEEWKESMEDIAQKSKLPISAAVGYAAGKGENLDEVIRNADQMMYENKRKYHKNE